MIKKVLIIFILLQSMVAAGVELGGSYENSPVVLLKKDGSGVIADLNRLRLLFDVRTGRDLSLHLEPRYYYLVQSNTLAIAGISDINKIVWDKYYLKANLDFLSLTAGKQRIAWGTGYIWNPTDVFNPYVLSFAVGQEDETNVEAARAEISLGAASGIDGYVLGDGSRRGMKAKTNVGLFDLSLSYVDLASSGFQWGVDFSGEWGIGIRGEVAARYPNRYFRGVLGSDYTFENGVYVNLEYFYNGLGRQNKDNYNWNSTNQLGRDYLYFGINKNLDEITKISGSVIANLNDQSFLIYPSYSRNVAENVDLSVESMLLGGQIGSEYNSTDFGAGKLGLVRIKYSF